ncbi:hypothetical protein BDN71DRAFT_1540759 [Pleurotus eryngii]|uniref:Uncharacterized protein n=1 Tax=Pleurotus eryngii TaxID=5323 RepID=A0A9P5ZGZ4_PLEER|nr:hypothetical protein BDN71DRAFT_1540759 [Pleurotus eryngii]
MFIPRFRPRMAQSRLKTSSNEMEHGVRTPRERTTTRTKRTENGEGKAGCERNEVGEIGRRGVTNSESPSISFTPNEMSRKFASRDPERTGKWAANGLGLHAIAQPIKKPRANKTETRNQEIEKEHDRPDFERRRFMFTYSKRNAARENECEQGRHGEKSPALTPQIPGKRDTNGTRRQANAQGLENTKRTPTQETDMRARTGVQRAGTTAQTDATNVVYQSASRTRSRQEERTKEHDCVDVGDAARFWSFPTAAIKFACRIETARGAERRPVSGRVNAITLVNSNVVDRDEGEARGRTG